MSVKKLVQRFNLDESIEELKTVLRGPRSSSFMLPQYLSNHMDGYKQVRTRETMFGKIREMTDKRKTNRDGLGES